MQRWKRAGLVAVAAVIAVPLLVIAGDLIFSDEWNVVMDGNGVELIIETGSEADEIAIDEDTISVTITDSGDSVTLTAPDANRLTNDADLEPCEFNDDDQTYLEITEVGTTVVTPSTTICSSSSGGGGSSSSDSDDDDEEEDEEDEAAEEEEDEAADSEDEDSEEDDDDSLPSSVEIDDLVKLPDDGDTSTQPDSAVYYVGSDLKRHPFPNALIYFSWFEDFDDVFEISTEDMAEMTIGTPILSRPGTALIKIQSVDKVYAVSPGNVLHWITTEDIAAELYGSSWANRVMDIEPTFFTHFSEGDEITTAEYPDGSLLLQSDTVYYVADGTKRAFYNDDAYTDNHFQWRSILEDATHEWVDYSAGETIYRLEEELFSSQMVPEE